jgi:hypothetical protein
MDGAPKPFYRRYLGALIAAAVSGTLGALVVLTTPSSSGAAKIGETIFGFLVMATLAFLVAWITTLLTRVVAGSIHPRSAAAPSSRLHEGATVHGHTDQPFHGSGIFVSYRRQDEPNFTGRLADQLVTRFGRNNVFMDVYSIGLGVDFEEAIDDALSQCRVVIVIIGMRWLQVENEKGERRLEDPEDLVRREIEAALARGTPIIPVLAEGATMPDRSDLPHSLAKLTRYNALEMSHARFIVDANRLFAAIEPFFRHQP